MTFLIHRLVTDPASHLRLPLTMPSYSRHSSSSDQSESSLPISTNSSLDLERSVDGGMPPDRVSPTPSLLVSRSPEHSGQANSQRSTPNEEDDPSPLSEFAQEGSRNLSQSFYDPFKCVNPYSIPLYGSTDIARQGQTPSTHFACATEDAGVPL